MKTIAVLLLSIITATAAPEVGSLGMPTGKEKPDTAWTGTVTIYRGPTLPNGWIPYGAEQSKIGHSPAKIYAYRISPTGTETEAIEIKQH